MNLAQLKRETWRWLVLGSVFLAGGCAGWLSWSLSGGNWATIFPGTILGGLVVGILMVLLGSVTLKLNMLRRRISRDHTSLQELTNIRPLLEGPPLDYGGWAIDPYFGKVLAQLISRHEPAHILECGSGSSTVFMTQLQNRGNETGSVTALEHLDEFAQKSRQLLQDHGVNEHAEVVWAPLDEWEVEQKTLSWYGIDTDRFDEREIDMLVVDGPPHSIGSLARYPAAFVLEPYLSEDCLIVLDDGDREDEEKAARRWADLLDADLEYPGGPKGTYILRR